MPRPLVDRTGQRFGRLLVLREVGRDNQRSVTWLCLCDCGNETVVESRNLGSGNTKSCGCYKKEMSVKNGHFGGRSRLAVVGYYGVHDRIYSERGPASSYSCIDCGNQARHWSYDLSDPEPLIDQGGTFSLDVNRYEPRCVSCHSNHDRNLHVDNMNIDYEGVK